MIDLSASHLHEVCRLLAECLPDAQVSAFGSRVSKTAAEGSDLDLVARSVDGTPLSLGPLREAFRESNLPISVELLDWAVIPQHFREEILKNCCPLQSGGVDGLIEVRGDTPGSPE